MCASFRIVLVISIIGKVSANTTLTIRDDQLHLECGTMKVLTCVLQSPPVDFPMHWLVDGVSVSECDTFSCTHKNGMNENYYTNVTAIGNIFQFYISPVDIFDNKTFTCTDGDAFDDIIITTEEVMIKKSLTTITNTTKGNNMLFDVTTNCVFRPGAVTLFLESKKVNGNGGYTPLQVIITRTPTVCLNTENAYCGGNKTNKLNINFAISTDTNGGEMHKLRMHLIQTLENGTNYTITFEIGQLKLPEARATTSTLLVVVYVLCCLAGVCIAIVVIIIVYSRCTHHSAGRINMTDRLPQKVAMLARRKCKL